MRFDRSRQMGADALGRIALAVAVISVWGSASSLAQCDVFGYGSVLSSDNAASDQFGNEIAVDGDLAVIGAREDNAGAGAAYVLRYDGSTWQEEAKLVASDAAANDSFGFAVAVSGDVIVVGALLNDGITGGDLTDAGAAYVFRFDGLDWSEEAAFTAFDPKRYDHFGGSVTTDGTVIVVGAYLDDDPAIAPEFNSGSAYIYRNDGASWVFEQKIAHFDPHADDYFGTSLALTKDTVFIGAAGEDDQAGTVYSFTYNGAAWSQATSLNASDGAAGFAFGKDLAVYGDFLLVGSWLHSGTGTEHGAAYVFQTDGFGWDQTAILTADDANSYDRLGRSVALGDGFALIGSYFDDDDGNKSGSAYIFRFDGVDWVQDDKLTAFDATAEDQYGYAVAVSGDQALIGAQLHDAAGTDSGQVYLYNGLTDCDDPCEFGIMTKIQHSNPETEDWFGYAVAVSGNVAVATTPIDSDVAMWAGSAHVFRFDGIEWVEEAELTASDPEVDDEFGIAAAIDGDVIVLGALRGDDACPSDPDCNSGSAYVFRYDGANWNEEAKLTASDAEAYDDFGLTVAIEGDVIVVGADQDGNTGQGNYDGHGAAYVFRYDGSEWNEEDKLLASDGEAFDHFGFAVSVSGNTALVGASADGHSGFGLAGSAYIYEFDGSEWLETAKLTSSDVSGNDQFGKHLSISGDTALIGALWNDAACNGGGDCNAGSAYIFEKPDGGWVDMNETAQLTASDASDGDSFGISVGISGDNAIVGAYGVDVWTGAAYVFEKPANGWVSTTENDRYSAWDGVDRDFFGYEVAIDGETAMIGSYKDDDNCPGGDDCDTGTAWMLAINGVDCNGNGIADSCDLMDGVLHDDDENGIPDECENLPCEGDANGDGAVDPLDSGYVLARFGCPVGTGDPSCDAADQNGDGAVDPLDSGFVLARFGQCE